MCWSMAYTLAVCALYEEKQMAASGAGDELIPAESAYDVTTWNVTSRLENTGVIVSASLNDAAQVN